MSPRAKLANLLACTLPTWAAVIGLCWGAWTVAGVW